MRPRFALGLALAFAGFAAQPAFGQPADLPIPAATTTSYPPGVAVRRTASGPVYTDSKARTLYGMDMRTVLRWSPDAAQYCKGRCAEWEPLLASRQTVNLRFPGAPGRSHSDGIKDPAEAVYLVNQRAPDWAIIAGPQGPQWVYKGWHMVYVRKGDRPGSTAHDGAEGQIWNTLKFVPPVPSIAAPAGVSPLLAGGAYALADRQGRLLFTGKCAAPCIGWTPLAAPLASRGFGEWTVNRAGDNPQWAWRGQAVFVGQDSDPLSVPRSGKVLRP